MSAPARPCPICGPGSDAREYAAENVRKARLGEYAYASRKTPEYMHLRLMHCRSCDLLYADPVPSEADLERAYQAAAFDTVSESRFGARSYAEAFAPVIGRLARKDAALDIGAGDGAFLAELRQAGFAKVEGIEPSRAPYESAAGPVRDWLRNEPFRGEKYADASFDLISCFQTLEHLSDPAGLCRHASRMLRPGGVFLTVCHDRLAWTNRLMGRRSPIFDIEHLQLFTRASATRLLTSSGLQGVRVLPVRNRYPLRYWVRLAPLGVLKSAADACVRGPLGNAVLTIDVGNMGLAGFKGDRAR